MLYDEVYKMNINRASLLVKKYEKENVGWALFKSKYKDPDGFKINESGYVCRAGIDCTADALLSARRIYNHEGFNEEFIKTYAKYRKEPIFFFPREQGGINQSRAAFFGDRIDLFLFDIKRYCSGEESKLESVYQKEKTKTWLESFSRVNQRPDFGELVKWFKIDGIFVNDNLEVFDLEKKDGSIIEKYSQTYPRKWSEGYYKNLKKKLNIYIKNNKVTT